MIDFDLTLRRPLIFLPVLFASVAIAVAATFAMMPAPEAVAAVDAPARPLLAAKAAIGRDRACDTCGIVKTIRRTDPSTGEPVYEFSVQMHDGSTRNSTEGTRGRWLEGDRVVVIGGAVARALEESRDVSL